MAKTSVDARKHVKEWSNFFSASRAFAEAAVKEFIATHKKRKYLRQSLQRLFDQGFIVKRKNELAVTAAGRRFFRKHGKISMAANRKQWDGKWRLVVFDVPINHDYKRSQIRNLLKEYDFYPLQKSVWVCPTHLTADFWKNLVKEELARYCRVMVVEFIENDGDLRKYFKLS